MRFDKFALKIREHIKLISSTSEIISSNSTLAYYENGKDKDCLPYQNSTYLVVLYLS